VAEKRDKRGLGRGLSSLLGEPDDTASEPSIEAEQLTLPSSAISPNPHQPRSSFDPAAISALAESIRESGLLQPLIVRKAGSGYQLIAGERRWRAALEAGVEEVPVIVRDAGDAERLRLALIENVVREDLNPVEIAQGCAILIEDFGQSHEEVGRTLGRSRSAVTNLVRLLELPDDVQDLIVSGMLTEGHGRAILGADGAGAQRRIARVAVDQGLSVRATEALVKSGATARSPRAQSTAPTPVDDRATEAFGRLFDVPVRVRQAARGRRVVELRFDDESALADALEKLS
jgi:ParB family chromosome partitioning protein